MASTKQQLLNQLPTLVPHHRVAAHRRRRMYNKNEVNSGIQYVARLLVHGGRRVPNLRARRCSCTCWAGVQRCPTNIFTALPQQVALFALALIAGITKLN
jgi:hypothetical protein